MKLFSIQASLTTTCGFSKGQHYYVVLLLAEVSPNHLKQVIDW